MKRSTMYKLRKHNVDENLINYMQTKIYPIYEHGNIDAGHQMPHIETVIDRSITFAEECEQNGMDIDYNMVYTIASYHDVGLSQAPRETHERKSAEMFRKDDYLKSYFSSDKFDTIKSGTASNLSCSGFALLGIRIVLIPALEPVFISLNVSPIIQDDDKSTLYFSANLEIIPILGFLQSQSNFNSGRSPGNPLSV